MQEVVFHVLDHLREEGPQTSTRRFETVKVFRLLGMKLSLNRFLSLDFRFENRILTPSVRSLAYDDLDFFLFQCNLLHEITILSPKAKISSLLALLSRDVQSNIALASSEPYGITSQQYEVLKLQRALKQDPMVQPL
ncbi:hypothetical protein IGI04_023763 [Brassica rapa subsp. trilocularis]|uniref:FBD domain-containing protein n=1 Tax=Brassica rapa subsp. trilocularis TaxID=1813537 RepID=A0ABQ7M677_BRACM|nr:hypothetical protein IGI04_023763 [Brassica rapa subsp. trilocularis]